MRQRPHEVGAPLSLIFYHGQLDGKLRALAVFALEADGAAMGLRDLPGNGQAQPNTAAAAPCSIQPVELLKDTGKLLLWYWYRRGS